MTSDRESLIGKFELSLILIVNRAIDILYILMETNAQLRYTISVTFNLYY